MSDNLRKTPTIVDAGPNVGVWAGVFREKAVKDLAETFTRLYCQPSTAFWYSIPAPLTPWKRFTSKTRGMALTPFEWLRDRLVDWLGCNCDGDY